ncbi:tetratricopeptide repeat protein [Actinokineospora sp.]|uniref:tetratricopeptide repeat protein n=1 Tax=Actinokineospora sp. TaxID=1872133 RepID=UPI004037E252
MEVLLLGPFEVRSAGALVQLGDLQQRYTLVVLVLHANKPMSTERLIDIVWAGQPVPKTSANLIAGYIKGLRKAFRDADVTAASIDTTGTGYLLKIDTELIDATRFRGLCERAARAGERGDSEQARVSLHEAVDLWRGDFLEGLDIDRVGGSEVLSPAEARLDALGDLAELELANGNHRWVRDRLRVPVQVNPTRQRLAGLLMRALVANGDRVQAMEVYHRTREAFDDYGMKTSVELQMLANLALREEPRNTVPAAPAWFTGRREELATIESRMLRATHVGRALVLWISGTPGVGKSALALRAAFQHRRRFPDGQIFVQLNGFTPNVEPTALGEAAAKLLGDLGVPQERIPGTAAKRVELYQAMLSGTRTLVVLDNAASEEQARPLLPGTAGCVAIVTSRRLGAVSGIQLEPLTPDQAAELFSDLVGAERVRDEPRLVAEVVARCGWVPMQITVTAAQFGRHPRWPLRHLLDLLAQAPPDGAAVAYTVSYQQLSEPQRTLFRLFGQIPGPDLSTSGAAALADHSVPRARALLEDLHGVSLLAETTPERYLMLDPLKEYAATVAPATPHESAEAMDRLLDFYLVSAAAAMSVAFPFERDRQPTVDRTSPVAASFTDAGAAKAWLAAERANLAAGITYAAGHGRPEHTWQLAVLLWFWYHTAGHLQDWSETLELARQTIGTAESNRPGLAYVLLRLSGARLRSGEPDQALEFAAHALSIWGQLGDAGGEAAALCAIAMVAMHQGENQQGTAHFEAALEKYRHIGDKRGAANALGNLGYLNEQAGKLELAESRHLAALVLLREIEHTQGLAHTLDNLGAVRQRLGRLDEALADHEQAHLAAIEVGDRTCEAFALNGIANVHRRRGRLDEALRYHEQARQVANLVGDPSLRTQLYLDRGATYLARGDHREALRAYLAALDLAAGIGDHAEKAHAAHGAARVLHAAGSHGEAVEHWQAAEAGFDELRLPEATEVRAERARLQCACAADPA